MRYLLTLIPLAVLWAIFYTIHMLDIDLIYKWYSVPLFSTFVFIFVAVLALVVSYIIDGNMKGGKK